MEKVFYELIERPSKSWKHNELNFARHMHKQIEIVYMIEGSMEVGFDNKKIILQEEELCIFFPNQIHSYSSLGFCRNYLITFDSSMSGDYLNIFTKFQNNTPHITKEKIHKDIPYCLKALSIDELTDQSLIKGYISVVLGRILPFLDLSKNTKSKDQNNANLILDYISNNYLENISIELVAKEVGISKYTVSRIFNERINYSFNDYVNQLRISYAQHLLRSGDIPVSQIAFESGFNSQRTFYRAFKNFSYMSPREYRETVLNNIKDLSFNVDLTPSTVPPNLEK